MKRRAVLFILGACLVALVAAPYPLSAITKEAWVVNGLDRSVAIVDLDLQALVRLIPLNGAGPEPGGIEFSTVDGFTAGFAYVAQGSQLHVIEAGQMPQLTSVNLTNQLGFPVSLVDVAAGGSRAFNLAAGSSSVENYLYAIADATPAGAQNPEPYYVVLDEKALIGLAPGPPVVDFGPLVPASIPPADRGAAAGVTVLGAREGDAFQRVWFTTKTINVPVQLRSIRLVKGPDLTSAWGVDRVHTVDLPAGVSAPEYSPIGGTYDRELTLLPTGLGGSLLNVETGGSCELGGDLRRVAIAGPGPGGYQILAVDALSDTVQRVSPTTCDVETFAVGQQPVAIAIDSLGFHGRAVVANQGSDSVSIIQLDGAVNEVMLPPGVKPVDIDIRKCCAGCRIDGLTVAVSLLGDDLLAWSKYGCSGCEVAVYCQCQDGGDPLCPCDCDPDVDDGCFSSLPSVPSLVPGPVGPILLGDDRTETPWIHLGNTAGGGYTHGGAGVFGLNYVVMPKVP